MRFINLTQRTEIGANSYYLEIDGTRLILDCGMHPKYEGEGALPGWKAINGRAIDAVLISHAHQDHIGTLPVLMRRQPDARVFMTDATAEVGSTLLHNSVNVMMRQREELGTTLYPLFTHRETERASDRWNICRYRQRYSLSGGKKRTGGDLTFEYCDAGHVLGSGGILLRGEGRTVFYTGDVNFDDQTIMQSGIFPQSGVDVLMIECTRGDNPTPLDWSRESEERKLAAAIETSFRSGGCVLIPVFALGKTQELLAMFYKLRRQKLLGEFPIYIGGLSSKMTEIYDQRAAQSRRHFSHLRLLQDIAPFILNGQTVGDAPARSGRVYALSSGMMTPKTLSNIFARRVIENPRHAILFVGYADPESPGGILRTAQPGDRIRLDPDERAQTLRCHVEQFQFSAHASRESLIAYAKQLSPRKILLVHGDAPAVEWMRVQLSLQLPASEVVIPAPGIELEL